MEQLSSLFGGSGGGKMFFQQSSEAKSSAYLQGGSVKSGDFNVSTGGMNMGSMGIVLWVALGLFAVTLLFRK
jgi:hypothetical protein